MKIFTLVFQVLVLITSCAYARLNSTNTSLCYNDGECSSFCCNNNLDYKVQGYCVPIEEDSRCLKRKKTDLIILYSLYAILIPVLGLCAYVKVRQEKAHTEYLRQLRLQSKPANNNEGDQDTIIINRNPNQVDYPL